MQTCLEWFWRPFLTTTEIMRKDRKIGEQSSLPLNRVFFPTVGTMNHQRRKIEGVTERTDAVSKS